MPHLVVKKRGADEVEHVHHAVTMMTVVVVVVERGDVRAEDAPPETRELLRRIELAQIPKVVFADEARRAGAHRVDVEVPRGEKVLVVSRAAREACGEGGCDGRPGVDADRGREDGVERVDVSDVSSCCHSRSRRQRSCGSSFSCWWCGAI